MARSIVGWWRISRSLKYLGLSLGTSSELGMGTIGGEDEEKEVKEEGGDGEEEQI